MRTSRVSRDTTKLFERVSGSASPPRRATRSSLTRFARAATSTSSGKETRHEQAPDIEDAISLPPAKRQRRGSATSPTSGIKSELVQDALHSIPSPPKKPTAARRERKPARAKTDRTTGETKVDPPSDWEEMYAVVQKMRAPGGAAHGAAVDTMGCERLADRNASAKDQRFHTLVALMLSSQTKDTVNAVAMAKLKTELPAYKPGAPKGLNLDNMLAVDPKVLNEMIWAVGFHNNKTKHLKQAAIILRDSWNGDIPDTIEGLISLPGVGPKMGYLCLSAAWNKTEGIGVDVHVHRITNLWGWNKTKTPEETRLALQSWLPQDRWREINSLLVGLGQAVCLPVGRKCGGCELGLQGLCKAAERKKVAEGRRVKDEAIKDEAVKVEAVKVEAVKVEAVKVEAVKVEAVKVEEGDGDDAAVLAVKKEVVHAEALGLQDVDEAKYVGKLAKAGGRRKSRI